jgi:catechol 2,3-dioxygenase-like lactoylglutathione lyase family enzyme
MKPQGILETALYCRDLEAASAFYANVMGLVRIGYKKDRHVFFRCGEAVLLVFNPGHTGTVATSVNGVTVPLHGSRGPGHVAFRAEMAEIDRWRAHLAAHGVDIEAEISWPEGGRSLYFRDPCGNSIEIATPELWSP